MNNKKKALVSGLAGAALLAGTGATFALWQAEAPLEGAASISIGHMAVEATIDWDDSISYWVPTDVATGTITIDRTLLGDNLLVTLHNNGGLDDTIVELSDLFDVDVNFDQVQYGEDNLIVFDESGQVTVPITVTFRNQGEPNWRTLGVYGADEVFEWNWSDLSIIITQVLPTLAP